MYFKFSKKPFSGAVMRNIFQNTLITLFIILIVSGSAYSIQGLKSFESKFVNLKLNQLEQQLIKDCSDKVFSNFTIFEAGLIASGIDNKSILSKYTSRFQDHINKIKNIAGFSSMNEENKIKKILKYIHTNIFKSYGFKYTTVTENIDLGRYHCLSSTVFFNAFCQPFGIKTGGTTGRIHAVSIVYTQNGEFLVETTNENGVKVFTEKLKRTKKVMYDNVDLVAAIFANRAAFQRNKGKDEECIILSYKALLMSPKNKEGYQNFKAGYTSLGIKYQRKKEYKKAADLMREIIPLYPQDRTLKNNLISYVSLEISNLIQQKKYDEVKTLLEKYLKEFPKEKNFTSMAQNIYFYQSKDLIAKGMFEDSISACQDGLKAFPKNVMLTKQLNYTYAQWSYSYIRSKDWKNAIDILKKALKEFPNDSKLKNNLKYCEQMLENSK